MKIYVDEMIDDCFDCPCHNGEDGRCKILDKFTDYVPKNCPLHHISEREKELIMKIKLAIRKRVHLMEDNEHCYPQNAVCWQDVVAILNQVERGNTNEINND